MVVCLPREKLLFLLAYGTSRVLCNYWFSAYSRMFSVHFQSNITAADIKKFRVSAYSLGRLIGE